MDAQLDEQLFEVAEFEKTLQAHRSQPIPVFRNQIKLVHNELKERFYAGRSATELVYTHALFIDEILKHAWSLYFDKNDGNISLLAVGGYGRGELHPYSDIDLMILLRKSAKPYRDEIIAFTTFLWDIGLEVGHSVRTLKECIREVKNDITIATNMQEARLLVGPADLFEKQKQQCGSNKYWPSNKFFAEKLKEQHNRHARFHDTAYNLEPNIKEGPGGLRDIQMIGWVAKRHFGAKSLHDLVTHDFLTEEEYKSLHEGQAFLWQIRYGLHIAASRREDRLLFDHQRTLARQFGYRDDSKSLGVEKFMKQYYRTIMELSRLNEMLLQLFDEEILSKRQSTKPVSISKRFQARKNYLEVASPDIFTYYPFALLEVFLLMAQHSEIKGVAANTIRLIRHNLHLIDAKFRDDIKCRSLFMEILRQTHGVTHELRRMNRYGVLAEYLPVFGKIVGQMQHDLFHVYTVDEHTLMVIRNLRRFTVPEFYNEFPTCSRIIQDIPKQELLILAGLFHDIAKGRGGDHSTLGADEAIAFCQKHDLSDYDTNIVSWLVLNHLIMSTTAQRKDISDPVVVHEFAENVGNLNRLNYLYLLTVADIRATSDDVWNSWKDALLKELYYATKQALRRGLENPILNADSIAITKETALSLLEKKQVDTDAVLKLWERLEDDYFLRYLPEEVSWHTDQILRVNENQLPLVLIRHTAQRGGSILFIYGPAHDGIFAHATSAIEQLGLTIVDARIMTSKDNYILDSFIILDESGDPITDQQRLTDIITRIKARVSSPDSDLPEPAQHLPRQTKAFRFDTKVQFWQDEKNNRTAMQVTTYDRPGLLSRIARVMLECGLMLQNAKIATFGERAEDIFYITDNNGKPITDVTVQETIRNTLIENL